MIKLSKTGVTDEGYRALHDYCLLYRSCNEGRFPVAFLLSPDTVERLDSIL